MQGGLRKSGAIVMTRGRLQRFAALVQKFIDDAYEVLRPRIRDWNALFPAIKAAAVQWAAHTLVRTRS